jgi:hypothetical protein
MNVVKVINGNFFERYIIEHKGNLLQ